jgi:enamine deaminase RidA (YjgF/YER057c/UK114 family)
VRAFLRPAGFSPEGPLAAGYSHAVLIDGLLLISGQVAKDPAGRTVGIGDPLAQAEQVYANLKAVVEHAGGSMADVVSTRTYLLDRAHRPLVASVRKRYFTAPDYPCNTLLIVAGLADPDFLLEVEAVADLRR